MRHRKSGRQFGRNTSHRRAMLRALTANLVLHERIETTDTKAKELKRVAERVITRATRLGNVAYTPHETLSVADRARRLAAQKQIGRFLQRFGVRHDGVQSEKVDLVEKVFVDLAKRYEKRPGGYTRIIKLGRRRGDNAPMALVEFVQAEAAPANGKTKRPVGETTASSKSGEAPEAATAAVPAGAAGESAAEAAAAEDAPADK